MNPEIIKVVQVVLEKTEKISNVTLNQTTYKDANYNYFTADSGVIYVPIFSEKPIIDSNYISFLEYLKKQFAIEDIRLLFYTRKLKVFLYSYSAYKPSIPQINQDSS